MRERPRITIGRCMIAVAVVAILLGLLPRHPVSFVLVFFLATAAAGFILSDPSNLDQRVKPRPKPRPLPSPRLPIWTILGFVAFAAVCLVVATIDLMAGVLAFGLFGAAGLVVLNIARGRPDPT